MHEYSQLTVKGTVHVLRSGIRTVLHRKEERKCPASLYFTANLHLQITYLPHNNPPSLYSEGWWQGGKLKAATCKNN